MKNKYSKVCIEKRKCQITTRKVVTSHMVGNCQTCFLTDECYNWKYELV